MTLHEAIEKVLKDAGKPLKASEIADLVNKNQLYSRGDNLPVPSSQIHARVRNYPEWFVKDPAGSICLHKDRLDSFADAVLSIFNRLRNNYLTDTGYIIALVIFYKRWIDHPGMLEKYSIKITIKPSDVNKAAGLKSFYECIIEQLRLKGKIFDKTLIDNIFVNSEDSYNSIETAITELSNFSFSKSSFTVREFGTKFSALFTSTYINLEKTGLFSTPESVSKLLISLASSPHSKSFYNPAGGYFTFPSTLSHYAGSDSLFFCEEINKSTYSLGLLNLIANGVSIDNAYLSDSLTSSLVKDESADVVICNPPLGRIVQKQADPYPFSTSDAVTNFIQLAIKKIRSNGIVIFIVPDRFLFSLEKGTLCFRKKLIYENLLDTVISLPSGVFNPFSSVKTSIIILKKDRTENKVLFLDAEKYCMRENKGIINLNAESITDQVGKLKKGMNSAPDLILNEAEQNYDIPIWALSDISDIQNNEFDIQVKRYLYKQQNPSVNENESGSVVKLKDILDPYRGKLIPQGSDLPFLKITNLNTDFTKVILEDIDQLAANNKAGGHVADKDLLLVGAIEGSLKPTFFKYSGRKVVLSSDIYSFVPDISRVEPEYLVFELASGYVTERIKAISKGTSIKRITVNDFLNLEIKLPVQEEQRKIVTVKKEALANRPGLEGEYEEKLIKSAENEKKILGALKHELSPIASILQEGLKKLDKYLDGSSQNNKPVNWADKISGAANSRSLKEFIDDLRIEASRLSALDDNIRQIIEITGDNLNFEEVEFKRFIREQVEKWEYSKFYNVVYSGEKNNSPDISVKINRKQFAMLVRNFLENTHKHGYPEKNPFEDMPQHFGPYRNIVFDVLKSEDSVIIEMINDGQPFPKDFSFEQFTSFGGHGGFSKGSGIGGYLMNQIVLKHGGELKILEPGRSLIIHPNYKLEGNQVLPMRQITAGIYFRIILPLTNEL